MHRYIILGAVCALAAASAANAQTAAPTPTPAPAAQAPTPAAAPAAPAATAAPTPAPAATAAPAAATAAQPAAVATAPAPAPTAAAMVAYVSRSGPPPFTMLTPGSAGFGAIGAVVAMSQGHEMAVQYKIADPSNRMGREVAVAYAKHHGGDAAAEPDKVYEGDPALKLRAGKSGSDAKPAHYIVDVSTSLEPSYFPLDWVHYGLMFMSNVRVIDTTQYKVVAKGKCFLRPKKTPESPNLDQLFADDAAKLRKMIDESTQECSQRLQEEVLKS
ncbi:MAG: hypothetical protein JSR45_12830 [Proteobacteria bacterium]|nr:hypothetical protein [Pseudomonadota bacterium]